MWKQAPKILLDKSNQHSMLHLKSYFNKINSKKIPYELWKDRKSNIGYFHIFSYRYFVLNNSKDSLGKFDAKSDEAIFLGYFTSSKAFRVFIKRLLVVEESIHIVFHKTNDLPSRKREGTDDAGIIEDAMKELTLNDSDQQNKV